MGSVASVSNVCVAELIRACDGCYIRCETASQCVGDSTLSRMLAERGSKWRFIAETLREQADVTDPYNDTRTRILDALHRAMIKIKSALNNDRAVAVSCADQEGRALQAFAAYAASESHSSQLIDECIDALGYIDLARHNINLRVRTVRS